VTQKKEGNAMAFFSRHKNLGMLILAIFLIVWGVLQLGVNIPYAGYLTAGLAIAAGILILLGR
jgi:hypothetical protein